MKSITYLIVAFLVGLHMQAEAGLVDSIARGSCKLAKPVVRVLLKQVARGSAAKKTVRELMEHSDDVPVRYISEKRVRRLMERSDDEEGGKGEGGRRGIRGHYPARRSGG